MIQQPVQDSFYSKIVSERTNLETGPWVAGGSVRKVWFNKPWQNQDIDFFFANEQQLNKFCETASENNVKRPHVTSNAISYTVEVKSSIVQSQVIKLQAIRKRFYLSYEEIINDFDINLCQFVTDGRIMLTTEQAIADCQDNMIRANPLFNKSIKPQRILKYSAYGFDPDPQLLANLFNEFGSLQAFDDEY